MKTQKKTFLMMVFFFMVAYIPKVSATAIDTIYVVANTSTETHYICYNNINDSVMMHCPIGHTGVRWMDPSSDITDGPDSVFVKNNNEGHWMFYSDQLGTWKDIYVYLVSIPYEPASMVNDTSVCTTNFLIELNAENPASSYQWSTGATTVWYDATTPGTYTVTVTNTCGTGVYSKTISYNNPNAPHLGADQTFCWGSNTVLDPGSTNVTSYQWSTGATSPTITVDTTGTYWVYLIDNNGCSGRDTIEIEALLPISEEICYVEFDTVTWKNNVNWTSTLPGNADSVRIYKEDGINWIPIGTVYKTTTNFLDMASDPQAQSYSYKIAVIDTCGNESVLSSYHKTITLLSAYDQPSNTYGFTWSHYEGLVVTYYYLYGIDASNNVHLVATVNGSDYMYNYVGPNPAYIKYYVGFETPNCDGTKANVIVKSNWIIKDPLITGTEEVNYVPFSIYPTPANDQLNLSIEANDFQVEVLTLLGQVVLTEHNAKILDVSNLTKGTYIISISVDGIRNNKVFTKH